MSKEVTFQLDISAASTILTEMAMPTIKRSGEAIAARAQGMINATSSKAPEFATKTRVGIIKRGNRAIATVSAPTSDEHEKYIANAALSKSIDAGRV